MRPAVRFAQCLLLASMLPLAGCAQSGSADTSAATSTNAQGCVRKRHLGPQDPFQTPPPLMEACLGPYELRIPANYFDDQMGPNFDDSFGLYLEYPSLQPFAPGERTHLRLDVATRTVAIGYHYLDGVNLDEVLYSPNSSDDGDPAERLEGRVQGKEIHGLTPYYADLEKSFAFYRKKGYDDSNSSEPTSIFNVASQEDWYVARDQNRQISTLIKCTSHGVTQSGVEYRDGKLVRSKEDPLPRCAHLLVLKDLKVMVEVRYVRFALPDWKKIEQAARDYLNIFIVNSRSP